MVTNSFVLLSGVTVEFDGVPFDVSGYKDFTALLEHVGGGTSTVTLEAMAPSGNWVLIHSQAFPTTTGSTTQVVQFSGPFQNIRANVEAITGGAVNVGLIRSVG